LAKALNLGADVAVAVQPRTRKPGGSSHSAEADRRSGLVEMAYRFDRRKQAS
jgi:hypothetical protein